MSKNRGRGRSAFDRLKWEKQQEELQKGLVYEPTHISTVRENCEAITKDTITASCKSRAHIVSLRVALFYTNCENRNNFVGSAIAPLLMVNIKTLNKCKALFTGCAENVCPYIDTAMACVKKFDACVR